jgi:uridine kinase
MSFTAPHPVRLMIDGRSAAGKSTFASELAEVIRGASCDATVVSIDAFHTPGHKFRSMAEKYTPESYYESAFDYARFREWVLDPLRDGGDRRCRLRYWDSYRDEAYHDPAVAIEPDSVAIVEGSYLLRPEFDNCWDLTVWLDIDWEQMIERAVERDVAFVGDREVVRRRYEGRFRGVHELYERETCAPARTDFFIDNRDVTARVVLRRPPAP